MQILIIGLSGSGKTTLAKELSALLNAKHLNADELRTQYNDWDFSDAGRLRQAHRIKNLSDKYELVVCDFIAPQAIHRHIVDADVLIWMDTVKSSQYKDTDKISTAFCPRLLALNCSILLPTIDICMSHISWHKAELPSAWILRF